MRKIHGARRMNLFEPGFLFASLIWGSIGVGYCIYGKRQQSAVPLIGGVLMVLTSYFASSTEVMSVCSVGLIAAVHLLLRRGW